MMNNMTHKVHHVVSVLAGAIFSLFMFAGCERGGDGFDNMLFIDADNLKNEVRVALDENVETITKDMVVSMARPLAYDVEISFSESPELLDTYRQAYYDPEAKLLPSGHYDLTSLKAVIKAGNISTGNVALQFCNLKEGQGLDYDKCYVLPVTISAEGMETLPRARTMYFVVRKASLVNIAADMASNCAWPEWDGFQEVNDMTHFTFEALVLGHAFKNQSQVHTIMGIEDKFLIRSGDAGLPGNQLQIAWAYKSDEDKTYRGGITAANMQLKPDVWYHLAVTFDGGEDKENGAEIKVYINGKVRQSGFCNATNDDKELIPIKSVNFMVKHSDESQYQPRCFWVGYSYDKERSFNGMMSEIRVWSKTLSESEINAPNHFYKLYPDAITKEFPKELVAYWKFNEAKGKTVKDYSSYGKDLTADHDFLWYPVDLPIK